MSNQTDAQQAPICWLKRHKTQDLQEVFFDKAAADAWVSQFLPGFAWLEELRTFPTAPVQHEPVAIEYWMQETAESGRWVTTGSMPKATAGRMLSDSDFSGVYPKGRIVEPLPTIQRSYTDTDMNDAIKASLARCAEKLNDERDAIAKMLDEQAQACKTYAEMHVLLVACVAVRNRKTA